MRQAGLLRSVVIVGVTSFLAKTKKLFLLLFLLQTVLFIRIIIAVGCCRLLQLQRQQ